MKKGFTLIELMIVIAIIGIILAVAAGFFVSAVDTGKIKPRSAIEQKQDPKPAIEQKQDLSTPAEDKKSL